MNVYQIFKKYNHSIIFKMVCMFVPKMWLAPYHYRRAWRCQVPPALPSAKCRALGDGPRQRADGGYLPSAFAECPLVRHSAKSLCRAQELGTRQSIFFLFFAFKLFLQPLHIKLKYILKFGTFLGLFAIYP
jgi:hypothetical protein